MISIAQTRSLSRRDLLRAAAVGSAGLAATALPLPAETRDHPVPGNPAEALRRLMDGNRRFVAGEAEAPRRSLVRVKELSSGQTPYAAILGCADSRVPVEILFDEGFGDLFTVRVAGNVATPEEVASLEYAVGVLGAQVILVLGHTACGAVTAAVEGKAVPGQISALFQHITPAGPAGAAIDQAIEANVVHQARVLRAASTVIREALHEGRVEVRGAVYSLEDGEVRLLD
ncbi:MAG TPA: carbonic anhydrase [Longimicrobiales bacterium]|nr:carbonic anhydrase [Longimicrobiales bacterium]